MEVSTPPFTENKVFPEALLRIRKTVPGCVPATTVAVVPKQIAVKVPSALRRTAISLGSVAVCEEMAVLAVFGPSAINHLGSHFRKPALSRVASRSLRRRQFRTSGWIMWSLPELRWSDLTISTREKGSVCEIWGRARQVVGGKRDGGRRHRRLHPATA